MANNQAELVTELGSLTGYSHAWIAQQVESVRHLNRINTYRCDIGADMLDQPGDSVCSFQSDIPGDVMALAMIVSFVYGDG